jgi:tripeptidyl-peptidase I
MTMSDPESEAYGQHWTEDEVIDFFAPHEDTINSVHAWLVEDGKFHPDRISVSTNKQ